MPSDTWTHTRSTPIRVDCAATQLSDASLAPEFHLQSESNQQSLIHCDETVRQNKPSNKTDGTDS